MHAHLIAIVVVGGFFAVKNTQFVQHNPVLESFAVISWNSIQWSGTGKAAYLAACDKRFS